MKAGTRVSFSNSPGSPGRSFGTFVTESGDNTVVAVDGTHGVNPLVSVVSERVAEVKEGESFSQHSNRVMEEARAKAKAESLKRQEEAAAKAEKAKGKKEETGKTVAAAIIVLALLLFGFSAKAASGILVPDSAVNVFTAWTTNQNVNPSYAIVTARSGNGGTPVITFINAGSDLTSSKITAYKVTSKIAVTGGSSTRIDVTTTNTGVNWQSGTIIIQHKVDDSYEKRTLAANTGSTNIVVTVAPLGTATAGDTVYFVTAGPTIFWGATTNSLQSVGGILSGQQGLPFLIEINGTSNLGMNSVAGFFAEPVRVPRPGL